MLDFRINTFLMVCKYMNFTKAAAKLHITQPAVSQHIHYLENLYQTRLFLYNGKKMYLSPSGRILMNAATTMTHDSNFLKEQIQNIANGHEIISFGATLTVGDFLLPDRLAAYIVCHPETQIRMTVENTNKLLSLLKNGELDFAVIEGYFPKTDYDSMLFSREQFVAVCSSDYKYINDNLNTAKPDSPISIHDLFHERLIIREPGSGSREIFEHFLSDINCQVEDFTNTVIVNNIDIIKKLLIQNCGISFLYKAAVKNELDSGILREIPISNMNLFHDISFLWNKGSIYHDKYLEIYNDLLP